MKKSYFKYIFYFCIILWGGVFISRVYLSQSTDFIAKIAAQIELIISIFILFPVFKIYKNAKPDKQNTVLWFTITNIGLLINEILWYFMIYFNNLSILNNLTVDTFLGIIILIVWAFPLILFLFKILKHNDILKISMQIKLLLTIIIIDLIIALLFLSSVHYAESILTLRTIIQIATFFTLIIVFDFVILCLINCESIGLIFFILGILGLILGEIIPVYMVLTKTYISVYGELFWLLGVLFNWYGAMLIYRNHDYNIGKWLRGYNSIKSKLILWCFSISIIGLLLFFMIGYSFSIFSKSVLLEAPIYIVFYSAIVITLSMFIGKHFEIPFKQIAENIKSLSIDNNAVPNTTFSTEEFAFLQDTIVESFKYREQADKLKHDFSLFVSDVVHDLKSPIMTLAIAVKNINNSREYNEKCGEDLTIINDSLTYIRNISNNILSKYHSLSETSTDEKNMQIDDGNTPRFVILSSQLETIVSFKQKEWQESPCNLSYNIDEEVKYNWFNISPTKFTRVISNLLNNAYQSLAEQNRNININLMLHNNQKIILTIQDSGCGIASDKLESVKSGISSKHSGKGRGLISATEYFNSLGGNLDIESVLNQGTKIIITLPIEKSPSWFNNTIFYSENDMFIALDDTPMIIALWQRKFMEMGIDYRLFLTAGDFTNWVSENSNILDKNIVLFTDFDLKDKNINGVDIIIQYPNIKSYLVTSHAEDVWLQELAVNHEFKLIPKSLIESLKFISN